MRITSSSWPQLFLPQSFREQERILFESDGQFKLSIKIGISDSVHPYPEVLAIELLEKVPPEYPRVKQADFALFEPQSSLLTPSSQT